MGEILGFLVKDHNFSRERVERAVQRARVSFDKANAPTAG